MGAWYASKESLESCTMCSIGVLFMRQMFKSAPFKNDIFTGVPNWGTDAALGVRGWSVRLVEMAHP